MAEQVGDALQAELNLVAAKFEEAVADLPDGLAQFVRSEVADEQVLAGVVLASAAPVNDSAEDKFRRVALASALELLQIALNIHRLLLKPKQTDSIDSFLLGGTILAGDYCFSRATVLAARTNHPRVVTIFAELLQELSQANLRRVIVNESLSRDAVGVDERESLFHSGAAAGVLLAGLSEEDQEAVVSYAACLGRRRPQDGTGALGAPVVENLDKMPVPQRERWRALVSIF
ncbi:MAG: hypothetical protein OXG26_00590 [Caldilineaceae bacterium]|nr:hypothetical protein [Caldilineaceae bacterium]